MVSLNRNSSSSNISKFRYFVAYDLPTIMIKDKTKGYRRLSKGTSAIKFFVLKFVNDLIKSGQAVRIQQSVFAMTKEGKDKFISMFSELKKNPSIALTGKRIDRWELRKLSRILENSDIVFKITVVRGTPELIEGGIKDGYFER